MEGHFVVTGAAGFIGLHLTDRLLADGRVVIGGKSFADGYLCANNNADIVQLPIGPRLRVGARRLCASPQAGRTAR